MVKNCTPYTFSFTSSLMVRGVSQNTSLGPRERLCPPTQSNIMLWMAGRAISSEEQYVTQTVRDSGMTGYANSSWSMQPCRGHGGGTRPTSKALCGLHVRTLGSHTCSTSGGPEGQKIITICLSMYDSLKNKIFGMSLKEKVLCTFETVFRKTLTRITNLLILSTCS